MLDNFLTKYLGANWFRRGLALSVLAYTFRLTNWGASFALVAIMAEKDLTGTAAVIAAVAAIPLGLITLVFSKYDEKRKNDSPTD